VTEGRNGEDIPRASEKDRDYFRRLGEWEAENERQAWLVHEALSLDERLARSSLISTRVSGRVRRAVLHDDPASFYRQAASSGLYRG
jgi:hypothetical protein